MFNIGPLELLVLAGVALIVIGPDRLPGFMREAASMLRTLRELATGARNQLRDELGPEFEELADLRNLNPRTAVQRAVFGDDIDFGRLNPRTAMRDAIFGDESLAGDVRSSDPRSALAEYGADLRADDQAVSMTKPVSRVAPATDRSAAQGRPRPRPKPTSSYDDVT